MKHNIVLAEEPVLQFRVAGSPFDNCNDRGESMISFDEIALMKTIVKSIKLIIFYLLSVPCDVYPSTDWLYTDCMRH